jgi:hypothetical protein
MVMPKAELTPRPAVQVVHVRTRSPFFYARMRALALLRKIARV